MPMELLPLVPPGGLKNSQAPWDSFDSRDYFEHNYRSLREDDRRILTAVRDHFGAHLGHNGGELRGLDVGAGTNLYPSLAMLPGARASRSSSGPRAMSRGCARRSAGTGRTGTSSGRC